MKKYVFAILMFGLLVLGAYGQTSTPFVSKEGGFRATPPVGFDKFDFEKVTQPADTGDLILNQYSSNLDRGTCMMVYYDLSESVFQTKSIQQMLEDGRDGAVKKTGGTLQRSEPVTIDGNPGLSVYLSVKNGESMIYARMDLVVVKPRIYNFLYISVDQAELSKTDVKDFFRSVRLQK